MGCSENKRIREGFYILEIILFSHMDHNYTGIKTVLGVVDLYFEFATTKNFISGISEIVLKNFDFRFCISSSWLQQCHTMPCVALLSFDMYLLSIKFKL